MAIPAQRYAQAHASVPQCVAIRTGMPMRASHHPPAANSAARPVKYVTTPRPASPAPTSQIAYGHAYPHANVVFVTFPNHYM